VIGGSMGHSKYKEANIKGKELPHDWPFRTTESDHRQEQ